MADYQSLRGFQMKSMLHNFLRICKQAVSGTASYRNVQTAVASKRRKQIAEKKRREKKERIKVGFIVQMPEVWDKEAPLFEAISKDERFEANLIIVPHFDYSSLKFCPYGDEKDFFFNRYPNAKILLYDNNNDMITDDSFDYIFYQRCWEMYLPKQLRCKNVLSHAITCYIPYCFHAAPEPTAYYQTDFFLNLCRFYCCSRDQYEQVSHIKGIAAEYLGYPLLDQLHYGNHFHPSYNILWTPRWTDDPTVGGTSFNKYKDKILELPAISCDIKLTLRPHPLTFENAIKQKWMTASEIEEYKQRVSASGALFDANKIIEETFKDTDILITDFTSSLITFFLSGRPIIYCTESDFVMIDSFREIIESCYMVRNWDELLDILQKLMCGLDPLYEKRQDVIRKLNIADSSVDRIIKDLVSFISYSPSADRSIKQIRTNQTI